MSRNGELALKKVIITYGVTTGTTGIRQLLAGPLQQFKKMYPQVAVDICVRRVPNPSVTGVYRDGSEKSFGLYLGVPPQVVQKSFNYDRSAQSIWLRLHQLATTCNDNDLPMVPDNWNMQRSSIQGTWNPWLWIAEGNEHRSKPDEFDRKLSEDEWAYYVDAYSKDMKAEHQAVKEKVKAHTEVFEDNTKEIAERWKQFVTPTRQTDLEHNLTALKEKGRKKRLWKGNEGKVSFEEYSLFAAPDHDTLGAEALKALRSQDQMDLVKWWAQRKEQLKPPK